MSLHHMYSTATFSCSGHYHMYPHMGNQDSSSKSWSSTWTPHHGPPPNPLPTRPPLQCVGSLSRVQNPPVLTSLRPSFLGITTGQLSLISENTPGRAPEAPGLPRKMTSQLPGKSKALALAAGGKRGQSPVLTISSGWSWTRQVTSLGIKVSTSVR